MVRLCYATVVLSHYAMLCWACHSYLHHPASVCHHRRRHHHHSHHHHCYYHQWVSYLQKEPFYSLVQLSQGAHWPINAYLAGNYQSNIRTFRCLINCNAYLSHLSKWVWKSVGKNENQLTLASCEACTLTDHCNPRLSICH